MTLENTNRETEVSIEHIEPTKALLTCPVCGCRFDMPLRSGILDDPLMGSFMKAVLERQQCDTCIAKLEEQQRKDDRQAAEEQRLQMLPTLFREAGIPPNMMFRPNITPVPVRDVANWIWQHSNRNLVLGGATGTGKTTSAMACLVRLIESYWKRVLYVKFPALQSSWRNAKMAETKSGQNAVSAWIERLSAYDVVCIDEFCGKSRLSESGEEMMFTLLDGVMEGTFKAKVWLLGNVRSMTLDSMFQDVEVIKRRIAESFTCGAIGNDAKVVFVNPWTDF